MQNKLKAIFAILLVAFLAATVGFLTSSSTIRVNADDDDDREDERDDDDDDDEDREDEREDDDRGDEDDDDEDDEDREEEANTETDDTSDEVETIVEEKTIYVDVPVTEYITTETVIVDTDGDGLLDNVDPHPGIPEILIVKDDNSNGVVDDLELEDEQENS